MKNIMALQAYMDTIPSVNHLSRVLTVFNADVLYQDDL